jgi:transcriptional regulator with XRE-family HTH domain
MRNFASSLRLHRLRFGFAQREVATLLGTDQSHQARYELGTRSPSLPTLLAMEIVMGVPVKTLFPQIAERVRHEIEPRLNALINELQPQADEPLIAHKLTALQACLENLTTPNPDTV